jgi:hypothetical protein
MSNNTHVTDPSKILFAEGDVDSYFIESLLKAYNLRLGITTEPKGGIGNMRVALADSDFRKKLSRGGIKRFGIVADADSPAQDGAGFNNRWLEFIHGNGTPKNPGLIPIMKDLGMVIPTTKNLNYGEVFSNADDSLRIGLWLMPNHEKDGYLEDFVLACTKWDSPLLSSPPNDQHTLKNYADDCLQELDQRKLKLFANYHHSKASAYTWLAWQTKPTQFLSGVIEAGLLDMQHPYVRAFKDWIERCFK